MKKQYKGIISSALTVMVLTACGPQSGLNLPENPSVPAQSGSSVSQPANTGNTSSSNDSNNATGNTNTSTPAANTSSGSSATSQASDAAELEAAMQAIVADESSFADAETASDGGGFATQALRDEVEARAEIQARAELKLETLTPEQRAKLQQKIEDRKALAAATKARLEAAAERRLTFIKERRAAIEATGALSVNGDGTVTIDVAALKAHAKAQIEKRKALFQANKAAVKANLELRKELAAERRAQLRRKNQIVRQSEVQTIENEDGSTTKIATVEFENTRTGMKRVVTHSRTFMDGKLMASYHELQATGPNGYERNVTRSMEVMQDGSRNVNIEASTTWPNGKKRERSESRIIAPDGSASGSGVVTVTYADGSVKTFDYGVDITAAGEVVATGDDAAGSSEASEESVEVSCTDSPETEEITVVVQSAAGSTETQYDESDDPDLIADESASGDPANDPALQ